MTCIRCYDARVVYSPEFLAWSDQIIAAYVEAREKGLSPAMATEITSKFPKPAIEVIPCLACYKTP